MSDPFDLSDVAPAPPLAPPAAPAYLDSLNDAQRAAVEATDGPVLVLAGAGTGKTRVLTTRLAHILDSGLAHPGETLTVTFTNKAAREMKERVEGLLGRSVEGWFLGTFHAMAARVLRRHAELVGLESSFTIIDTDDQLRLIKQVMVANDLDDKKWPARSLAAIIGRWKDRGLVPDKVSGDEAGEFANGRAVELYGQYQTRLAELNAADFGDLLLHNLTVFGRDATVLAEYQQRFRYILVDEYQDANVAQYLWLRLLAQTHRNICCVGDDDQSIYAWRGAEVGNILRFEKEFPGARIIRLESNYRSTGHILAAASGLITHNEGRLGKTLYPASEALGDKVRVLGTWDGNDEASTVSEAIEALQRDGHALHEMAILVRAGFQTRAFEERFLQIGLPYRVIGGLRFYERLEVRDAIAYLRALAQPADDLAFERIVNKPKRGIGDASLRTVNLHARTRGIPLQAAARELIETDELRGRARKALAELLNNLERWRISRTTMALRELASIVLDESGYIEMWHNDRSVDAPGRLENLTELVNALDEFDNLESFLEHVSLIMENAEAVDNDMVNVMTLHGAKGLEFDSVFLPGWEEELFPNRRSLEEGGVTALEEERRLAYVGLTRARHRAVVLYAANRLTYGQWLSAAPSRFVAELPEDHVQRESVSAAYYAGFGDADAVDPTSFDRPSFGGRTSSWRRHTSHAPIPAIETQDHAPGTFAQGSRVFHQKFGYGEILAIDGNKLEIAFDKAGTKKVMDSFVNPA